MATTYQGAIDAMLGQLKTAWDANTPALNGGTAPVLVYEALEADLKPHPADGTKPWARVVIRHNDSNKVTLTTSDKTARYRRTGLVWVQVFTPAAGAANFDLALNLAIVAQKAFEGKRTAPDGVLFTKAAIYDRAKDGQWFVRDVRVSFYWDELH